MAPKYSLMLVVVAFGLPCFGQAKQEVKQEKQAIAAVDYEEANRHEILPHRSVIPLKGVEQGFNQFRLTLRVSDSGEVTHAEAAGDDGLMKLWPAVEEEVLSWNFVPFERGGKKVEAEVEEYLDLVPLERLPKVHVTPPIVRLNSKVEITLERTGCFGTCPSYSVSIGIAGIVFEGRGYVLAAGRHFDRVDPVAVRALAKRFVDADFYSLDADYVASVTDNPTYSLSITIDGHAKSVRDYVGQWVGMPAAVNELERAVDEFAKTDRWIAGSEGLVEALQAEKFRFTSFEAQVMLKEARTRGATAAVRGLLDVGVPLDPLPGPKPTNGQERAPFANVGWLSAASRHRETLLMLIEAEASKDNQTDQDLALVGAARSGDVEALHALIEYGADPNADLGKLTITENSGWIGTERPGAGSVLQYAAESGNPEMLKAILEFHPDVNLPGQEGKTPLFAAVTYRDKDVDGARAECVRLLVEAGADVNARDDHRNTPLHETFLREVEEELLKMGADVNAQNEDGETPIFTTVDDRAIELYIKHGADLTIRNKKGETVFEAAQDTHGPQRVAVLEKAMTSVENEASDLHTPPE